LMALCRNQIWDHQMRYLMLVLSFNLSRFQSPVVCSCGSG
jgi:hypothetical protein